MLQRIYSAINRNLHRSEYNCFKGSGKITFMSKLYGIVDDKLFFNIEIAYKGSVPLVDGMTVSYLAYRQSSSQTLIIIKILTTSEDTKKVAKPNTFAPNLEKTNLNNDNWKVNEVLEGGFIGTIVYCDKTLINFRTKYDYVTATLDEFPLDFVPSEGDSFYLSCKIDDFDNDYKILGVTKMSPVGLKTVQKKITKLEANWGVLDNTYLFMNYQLPNDYTPQIGDEFTAKVIESKKNLFNWRCIEIKQVENRAAPNHLDIDFN